MSEKELCRCATECEWLPEHYALDHHPLCPAQNGLAEPVAAFVNRSMAEGSALWSSSGDNHCPYEIARVKQAHDRILRHALEHDAFEFRHSLFPQVIYGNPAPAQRTADDMLFLPRRGKDPVLFADPLIYPLMPIAEGEVVDIDAVQVVSVSICTRPVSVSIISEPSDEPDKQKWRVELEEQMTLLIRRLEEGIMMQMVLPPRLMTVREPLTLPEQVSIVGSTDT